MYETPKLNELQLINNNKNNENFLKTKSFHFSFHCGVPNPLLLQDVEY